MRRKYRALVLFVLVAGIVLLYLFRRQLRISLRKRRFRRRLARYRDILRSNPGDDEAVGIRYMIGRILQIKLGDVTGAMKEYQYIADNHSEHVLADSALYNVGRCYEVIGDDTRAEMIYLRLLRNHPGSSRSEDARLRLDELSLMVR